MKEQRVLFLKKYEYKNFKKPLRFYKLYDIMMIIDKKEGTDGRVG